MRLLVTGATGFVGGYLCAHLGERGHEVIGLARDGNVDHRVDVCRLEDVLAAVRKCRPDGIAHLAAVAFVPRAEREAQRAELVNVEGTRNVLDAARACDARVLFVSSGAVYGDGHSGSTPPFSEVSELSPRGVYAATKVRAEELCLVRAGLQPIVRVRAFNHTGPGQDPDYVCSNFAKQIAEVSLGLREPCLRVGDLTAERDFCDVRDIVKAYAAAMERGRPGEVYNVCSGVPTPIATVVDLLAEAAGVRVEVEVERARLRTEEASRLWGNPGKAAAELAWAPQIPLHRTLAEMLAWWRDRLSGMRPAAQWSGKRSRP